jgi:hypothetical protein
MVVEGLLSQSRSVPQKVSWTALELLQLGWAENVCEHIFAIHYGGNLSIMNGTRGRVLDLSLPRTYLR